MKFSKVIAASIAASAASAAYLKDDEIKALYARQEEGSSSTTTTTTTGEDDAATSSETSTTEESSTTTSTDDSTETTSTTSEETSETTSTTSEETSETTSATESTTSEETTSATESTSSEGTTSATESTTSEETTSATESTSLEESSTAASTPATAATPLPTTCNVASGPISAEDAVKLDIIFGEDVPSERATTYADWLVNYLSGLASDINDVSHLALAAADNAYTTAFDTLNIPEVLGLASAAPMYTCYLSSLWAEALANPDSLAKRAVPTPEEKTKLMVLFERREQNGVVFNYADILIDETEDLIAEVRSIASAALTATDLSYTSLFTRLDASFLLSVASAAPIYTEGLSEAFNAGFTSSSPVLNTTLITSTAAPVTSMSYTTKVLNGTTTITSCPPLSTVTVCDIVCESLRSAASSAAKTITVTSCDTMANGAVQTRYLVNTVCDEVCSTISAQAKAAEKTTIVTNYVAGQTKNNAVKRAAGFGVGVLGFIALLI